MLKKFDDLVDELENLNVDCSMLNDTFTALNEAFEYGVNKVPKTAFEIPLRELNRINYELGEIFNGLHEVLIYQKAQVSRDD